MCQAQRLTHDFSGGFSTRPPGSVNTFRCLGEQSANPLKLFLVVPQGRNSTILIAHTTDRPTRIELVLQLNGLPLRRRYIGGDSHKQTAGHPLLNRYPCSRILAVACSE